MLPFFTDPYPGELIYSSIARYHFYSGNIDLKDTLEEVFKSRSVIPSVEIGSHLNTLAQQIGNHYSVEKLLAMHTIYPFYAPFLSKKRQREIIQDVQGDGKGIYTRIGIIAGSICKKDGLYYCPLCADEDIKKYSEPYVHREHQLQGVELCSHHYLRLKKYPIDLTTQSRVEFIRFDEKLMDFGSTLQEVESPYDLDIQVVLSKMVYQLLNVDLEAFSREDVFKKYRKLLREKNLITASNRVRQKELFEAFQAKFPQGFLEKYESGVNEENEYNWLKVLTRNSKRHVHPFRHLLFLYFLDQDIGNFFLVEEDVGPFGKAPWPCLNKAAHHYKQLVIPHVKITRDYKSINPIGTFECSCGFIYARKGPDKSKEEKYRIGRVKSFGDIWFEKLYTLAKNNENLSTREIAKKLGVNAKTVKKYLTMDGQKEKIESKVTPPLLQKYRQQLLEGIQKYPNDSRTRIRERFKKEYIYLYRYDRIWLFKHLPEKCRQKRDIEIVNWSIRDNDYCIEIKHLCITLLALEKPVRITKSLIGRRLGILANLEKNLNKLPKSKKLLNKVTESVQQFQIRRCCKIIDLMLQNKDPVVMWKLQRLGAVKTHHFHKIKPHLEAYIHMKQDVNNHESKTS
ncbi:TnsD family transposase [Piscibacillus sp. B03]|uniref:TnsD family transposase n=1 Tax=Piscibacillus sp. B03 TaxID=3457430 RepID=UPI003FCC812A